MNIYRIMTIQATNGTTYLTLQKNINKTEMYTEGVFHNFHIVNVKNLHDSTYKEEICNMFNGFLDFTLLKSDIIRKPTMKEITLLKQIIKINKLVYNRKTHKLYNK